VSRTAFAQRLAGLEKLDILRGQLCKLALQGGVLRLQPDGFAPEILDNAGDALRLAESVPGHRLERFGRCRGHRLAACAEVFDLPVGVIVDDAHSLSNPCVGRI